MWGQPPSAVRPAQPGIRLVNHEGRSPNLSATSVAMSVANL